MNPLSVDARVTVGVEAPSGVSVSRCLLPGSEEEGSGSAGRTGIP